MTTRGKQLPLLQQQFQAKPTAQQITLQYHQEQLPKDRHLQLME
jgi:hypothetical protein